MKRGEHWQHMTPEKKAEICHKMREAKARNKINKIIDESENKCEEKHEKQEEEVAPF